MVVSLDVRTEKFLRGRSREGVDFEVSELENMVKWGEEGERRALIADSATKIGFGTAWCSMRDQYSCGGGEYGVL